MSADTLIPTKRLSSPDDAQSAKRHEVERGVTVTLQDEHDLAQSDANISSPTSTLRDSVSDYDISMREAEKVERAVKQHSSTPVARIGADGVSNPLAPINKDDTLAGDELPITKLKPKKRRVKRSEMPNIWALTIENVFEDQPGIESSLALQAVLDSKHVTRPVHVRQLIALCLDPVSSGFNRKKPVRQSEVEFKLDNLDPVIENVDKVRLTSLKTLLKIGQVDGADVVMRSIKSYGHIKLQQDNPTKIASIFDPTNVDNLDLTFDDDEDDKSQTNEQTTILQASRKVKKRKDVWDLLQKGLRDEMMKGAASLSKSTNEDPLAVNGWDLLDTFCAIWEHEIALRVDDGKFDVAPTLLSSFDYETIGNVRKVPDQVLEIVFWPYRLMQTNTVPDSREQSREGTIEPEQGDKGAITTELISKQRVAMRLLSLLMKHTQAGLLDKSVTLRLSVLIKELSNDALSTFLDQLPTSLPLFGVKLLESYLDSYSHGVKHNNSSSTNVNISPRKRGLSQNPSIASLASSSSVIIMSDPANESKGQHSQAAARLPAGYDKTLSQLLSRLPKEIPFDLVRRHIEDDGDNVKMEDTIHSSVRRGLSTIDLTGLSSSVSSVRFGKALESSSPLPPAFKPLAKPRDSREAAAAARAKDTRNTMKSTATTTTDTTMERFSTPRSSITSTPILSRQSNTRGKATTQTPLVDLVLSSDSIIPDSTSGGGTPLIGSSCRDPDGSLNRRITKWPWIERANERHELIKLRLIEFVIDVVEQDIMTQSADQDALVKMRDKIVKMYEESKELDKARELIEMLKREDNEMQMIT
ncbi:hypothetical protein OIO90_004642 [Microbotryomycetes sp. JL221]|nr:hypothetical protein OIO90_004642 [Microbotryomycetes sp. JL221]